MEEFVTEKERKSLDSNILTSNKHAIQSIFHRIKFATSRKALFFFAGGDSISSNEWIWESDGDGGDQWKKRERIKCPINGEILNCRQHCRRG